MIKHDFHLALHSHGKQTPLLSAGMEEYINYVFCVYTYSYDIIARFMRLASPFEFM